MLAAAKLPAFDALIFDCDGTLVLTGDMHLRALNAALQPYGLVIERDWYRSHGGLSRLSLLSAFAATIGARINVEAVARASIAATLPLVHESRLNTPVAAFAREHVSRVRMAVASNAEAPIVHAVLTAHGIESLFDPILTITEAKIAKPNPQMFVMAASAMGVNPCRCLVLEDSDQGLEAARGAGMPVVDVRDLDRFSSGGWMRAE